MYFILCLKHVKPQIVKSRSRKEAQVIRLFKFGHLESSKM